MNDIAVRVENLGKLYKIGARRERYRTLRDTLTEVVTAPFRRLSSVFSGPSSVLSHQSSVTGHSSSVVCPRSSVVSNDTMVLVVDDGFRLEECPIESRGLFDHAVAQARYGASIFWIRPGLLIREGVEDFLAYWQLKRDGSRRGIVEVIP